jgi:hypothetical protein
VALAYYKEHADEVDWHIEENSRTPDEWHKLYPGILPPPEE